MSELIVIISLLFTSLIGYLVISKIGALDKESLLSKSAFSFGLGVGLIGLQLFNYSLLSVEWSRVSLVAPWLILFVYYFLTRKDKKVKVKKQILRFKKVDKLLIVFIVLESLFVFFESITRPLSAWDGWASWLLKSKIFYIDGMVNPEIFHYIQSEYPVVLSLFITNLYILLGNNNDRVVLLTYFLFYLMTGIILFFSLKEKVGLRGALIGTLLLLTIQNIVRHGGRYEAGQADLPLGYFILASSILLLKFIETKKIATLVLLNIFLGITALIKNEGVPFSIFLQLLLVFYLIKFRMQRYLLLSLLYLFPVLQWQYYKYIFELGKTPYLQDKILIERSFIVMWEFLKEMFNLKNWNLLWILFICTSIYELINRGLKNLGPLFFIILFQFAVYFIVFLNTNADPALHIRNVFDRLLIHLAPLAVYITIINLYSILGKEKTYFLK